LPKVIASRADLVVFSTQSVFNDSKNAHFIVQISLDWPLPLADSKVRYLALKLVFKPKT